MEVLKKIMARLEAVEWGAVVLEDGKLSQGRLMGWVLFGLMIHMWLKGLTVPETLLMSWLATLTYNAGKKLTDPFKAYMTGRGKSAAAELTEETTVTEIDALDYEDRS